MGTKKFDIVKVIGKDVKLKKSGSNYVGFCPFCNNKKTPAFTVFPETQHWRCFSECNEGGSVVDYIRKRDGINEMDAIDKLMDK